MDKKQIHIALDELLPEFNDPLGIKNFIIGDPNRMPYYRWQESSYTYNGIIFIICMEGTAKVRINFKSYTVIRNTLLTILPNSVVEIVEFSEDLKLESLFFSVDFVSNIPISDSFDILYKINKTPLITVSEPILQDLFEIHSFIKQRYYRIGHPYREEIARSLLQVFMLEVDAIYLSCRIEENKTSSRQQDLVSRFLKLLLENYKQERTISFYSNKLCISDNYLSSMVKKVTGKNFLFWVNELLINKAKFRLKTTDIPIFQIAEELNFPNASLFGRFFKQHTGITPANYRNGN